MGMNVKCLECGEEFKLLMNSTDLYEISRISGSVKCPSCGADASKISLGTTHQKKKESIYPRHVN